jgi:excisionase family DNA binding protein
MENLITATEAARRYGVSTQTMVNWLQQGRVPNAQKVGREWAIPESALEQIERPKMGRPTENDNS